jgi:hypothetical protein
LYEIAAFRFELVAAHESLLPSLPQRHLMTHIRLTGFLDIVHKLSSVGRFTSLPLKPPCPLDSRTNETAHGTRTAQRISIANLAPKSLRSRQLRSHSRIEPEGPCREPDQSSPRLCLLNAFNGPLASRADEAAAQRGRTPVKPEPASAAAGTQLDCRLEGKRGLVGRWRWSTRQTTCFRGFSSINYRLLQKELHNYESSHKFIQRTCAVF